MYNCAKIPIENILILWEKNKKDIKSLSRAEFAKFECVRKWQIFKFQFSISTRIKLSVLDDCLEIAAIKEYYNLIFWLGTPLS